MIMHNIFVLSEMHYATKKHTYSRIDEVGKYSLLYFCYK